MDNSENSVDPSDAPEEGPRKGLPPADAGPLGSDIGRPEDPNYRATVFWKPGQEDLPPMLANDARSPGAASAEGLELRRVGRYELLRPLGRGGFGTVYLGRDTSLEREVAIKAPRLKPGRHRARDELLAEARRIAQLHHPGIVTVFDVLVEEHGVYIVSDYLPGPSLAQWLTDNAPTWQHAATVVASLADALAHAHSRRVVHRDLKPSNVILVNGVTPVLIDFGLALSDDDVPGSARGSIVGTPHYLSPEQARGEGHRIDGRSDIFALGVLLYRMITGRLPFQSSDRYEVVRQVLQDDPQPPRQIAPHLPRQLEAVCLKALAKDYRKRYTTAADLAAALRSLFISEDACGIDPARGDSLASLEETASHALPGRGKPPADAPNQGEAREITPTPTPSSVRRSREAGRRRVTVLQLKCDVYESAAIRALLEPEDQAEVLRLFQEHCRELVEANQGAVVQQTENGVLACFGFPIVVEGATRFAVRTGLAVVGSRAALNGRALAPFRVGLEVAAAVHTDIAVVEDPGGSRPFSLHGPIRNTVGQICELAEPGTVLISEDTRRVVRGYFDCEPRGPKALRGAARPVPLHEVRCEHRGAGRVEATALAGELTPLVGRCHEVGLLSERWEQSADGSGQVVLLTGHPGLGKSRLVHVLREHVTEHCRSGDDAIVEWRCSPQHTHSSLYPATRYFENLLEIDGATPAQHRARILRHLAGLDRRDSVSVGLLAALLSVPLGGEFPELDLPPQTLKERTLDLLADWVAARASRQPLLFIVEDLHWADATSLELLQRLVEQAADLSLMVLLTCRPEFDPPWRSNDHQTTVALGRLSKRQILDMILGHSGLASVPAAVADRIAERTEGVPLFVEEFTNLLLDARRAGGENAPAEPPSSDSLNELPATLEDLLVSRLDRIEGDLELVGFLSVLCREFTFDYVRKTSDLDPTKLHVELDKLVNAGLLHRKGAGPQARYQFKHALIQDAAYHTLLKRKRQAHHLKVGRAIEAHFPEVAATQPEALAHHFTEAGVPEVAIAYWEKSGERSLRRCAHVEALVQVRKALELLPALDESPQRDRREIRLLIDLAVPLQSTAGYCAVEVEKAYTRAHELCLKLGLRDEVFPILFGLFRYYMLRAQYGKSRELGEQLVRLAEAAGTAGALVSAHRALGSPLVYLARYEPSKEHLRKVLAVEPTAELRAAMLRYDVVDPWVAAHSYLAWAYWLTGEREAALDHSGRAIRTARELGHWFSLVLALSFSQWLHQFEGDVKATRAAVDESELISTEQGYGFWVGWTKVMKAWTMARAGDRGGAVAVLLQGLDDWRAQNSALGCHYFYTILAEIYLADDRLTEAGAALDAAEAFAEETGEAFWRPELARLRGDLLARVAPADPSAAARQYRAAVELARAQGARALELRAAASLEVHLARTSSLLAP